MSKSLRTEVAHTRIYDDSGNGRIDVSYDEFDSIEAALIKLYGALNVLRIKTCDGMEALVPVCKISTIVRMTQEQVDEINAASDAEELGL